MELEATDFGLITDWGTVTPPTSSFPEFVRWSIVKHMIVRDMVFLLGMLPTATTEGFDLR
jgi:hypothetical protein